jgi:hypothetical protein
VRENIREQFFVLLPPCSLERRLEQRAANTLTSSGEVDIRPHDTDVIVRVCVRREWFHALKADDSRCGDRQVKDPTVWKIFHITAFGIDAERRVERRINARLNDGIQDVDDCAGIRSNRQNLTPCTSKTQPN